MQKMGVAAIYPKPTASARGTPSKTYPYLLRGLSIIKPNQVWATDITYIRLTGGFVYLVAIMVEHPNKCISSKIRRLHLTKLLRFYILNPIHRCLKDGGKFTFP